MKTGCLIQDVRRVDLSDLAATRQGGSFIGGDIANENVAQSRWCKFGCESRGVRWPCPFWGDRKEALL